MIDLINLKRPQIVARARLMAGPAGKAIRYRLADHQGGRDPRAADCASHWRSKVLRIPLATADCAGFVAWCLGFDRFQPQEFSTYGGWINCDSMIIDARTKQELFEETTIAQPGDLVVYPSIDIDHDGSRDRVGHVGVVITPGGKIDSLRVIHCSASNDRRLGRAIAETSGAPWARAENYKGARNAAWGSMILRYKRAI